MSWTDDRVELLSRLWLEGKSASMIASALGGGLTRNAVIGKVHRLGLACRVKANGAPATPPEAEDEQNDAGFDILVGTGGQRRPVLRSSHAANTMPTSAVSSARMVQGNTALALAEAAEETADRLARSTDDVVVPMSLRVTIVDLRVFALLPRSRRGVQLDAARQAEPVNLADHGVAGQTSAQRGRNHAGALAFQPKAAEKIHPVIGPRHIPASLSLMLYGGKRPPPQRSNTVRVRRIPRLRPSG